MISRYLRMAPLVVVAPDERAEIELLVPRDKDPSFATADDFLALQGPDGSISKYAHNFSVDTCAVSVRTVFREENVRTLLQNCQNSRHIAGNAPNMRNHDGFGAWGYFNSYDTKDWPPPISPLRFTFDYGGMELLDKSKEDARAWANSTTSCFIDKITVGRAIVRSGDGARCEILLLKRVAHEAYYPRVFEMPGGKVDDLDASIRDAVVREVHEETGLAVTRVANSLKPFVYTTEERVGEGLAAHIARRLTVQLGYRVEVEGHGDKFFVQPARAYSRYLGNC